MREGTGLGLVTSVTGPALIDEALAGTPARRARKITPRLAMELSLARALDAGDRGGGAAALAQRPREADPGYDLPAASSLSDADAFLQVKPFLRLLALLCGQVRPVPLPGVTPVFPPPGTADGDRAAIRLRPLQRPGGPWRDGRWHGLRVLAKDGTVRVVADPKGADRKGERRAVPQRRALRPPGQHRRPRRPAGPHGGGHRRLGPRLRGVGGRAVPHRGDHPRRLPRARLRAGRPGPGRPRVPQQPGRRRQDRGREALRLAGLLGVETAPLGPAAGRRHLEGGDHLARPHRQGPRHRIPHGPGLRSPARPPAAGRPACGRVRPRPGRRRRRTARGADCAGSRHGTIRVEVSETVTIITSLIDPAAYPARDIADLYGMRWASELVYLEEKQTLSAGQPVTAATPAGAYRMAAATVAAHQALRIAGAAIAAAIGAEPARISATALRDAATASIRAGQGATTPGPERRDRHHPPRHHPAPAAVRHRLAARTALPPLHHQESSWGLAAWGSRETWPAGRLRVVTGRRCWRQVCCPCAWAGAVTGSRVAGRGGAVHLVRRFLV